MRDRGTPSTRPWLLSALVCAATAAATFALVFTMTAGASQPVSGPPIAASPTVSSPIVTTTPTRTFTPPAAPCAIVSPATIAKYLPGTTCSPDNGSPSWSSPIPATTGNGFYSAWVYLTFNLPSQSFYDGLKSNAVATLNNGLTTIRDSQPVTGLGDQAYVLYGTSTLLPQTPDEMAQAYLLVADGNAVITINYTGSVASHAVSQEQAEATVIAMAHDILAGLH